MSTPDKEQYAVEVKVCGYSFDLLRRMAADDGVTIEDVARAALQSGLTAWVNFDAELSGVDITKRRN